MWQPLQQPPVYPLPLYSNLLQQPPTATFYGNLLADMKINLPRRMNPATVMLSHVGHVGEDPDRGEAVGGAGPPGTTIAPRR